MTAEIFLASFLGCWLAIIVTSVLLRTVYLPLQRWLIQREFKRRIGDSGDLVSVGADYVPCPLESPEEQANSHRQFEAQSELCLVALDVTDDFQDPRPTVDRLIAAAQALRRATTPRIRKQMRAQHAPDDPV
jgi:hypothetical protein